MIELFSRKSDVIVLPNNAIVTPISVDESIASLSAILLDDDYYQFLKDGRELINGVPILDAPHLIPFKMKAWLDLSARKAAGEKVDSRDIRKHLNDVFRLSELLMPSSHVDAPTAILTDIHEFTNFAEKEEINLKQLGIRMSKEELFHRLSLTYGIDQ